GEREAQAIAAVREGEVVVAEAHVDAIAADPHVFAGEGVDVAFPAVAAHQHRQPRQLRPLRRPGADVVGEAEVDEQIEAGREDTEVMPLLVAARTADGERRAAEEIATRHRCAEARPRQPPGLRMDIQGDPSASGSTPAAVPPSRPPRTAWRGECAPAPGSP